MKIRTINQVITSFRRSLSSLNPDLSLFPTYSNLYVIFRAIASIITDQEFLFNEELIKHNILYAEGVDLEVIGSQYNVYRLEGSKASGYVLASGPDQIIRKGSILSNVSQDLEYEVTSNVNIIQGVETPIPVLSKISSSLSNQISGTYLYSRSNSNVKFIVGDRRDNYNNIIGGIVGGLDKEKDSDFRKRITNSINGVLTSGSFTNIYINLKSLDFIGDLFIREHFPVPGIVSIYSNVKDAELIKEMEDKLLPLRPLGVTIIFKPILRYSVNLDLQININNFNQIEQIDSYIDSEVYNYFSSLSIGEKLKRDELKSKLLKSNLLSSLTILKPESDINLSEEVLLIPGQIRKSFHEI
ncbi:baseplate J/gp47 family protein [Arthrospira platensis SPKY2]